MDLKSIFLLLGLWKSIYCQDCEFSYGQPDYCDLTIMCKYTSDIENIAESRIYNCPSWKRRATFSNLIPCGTSITCSSCENENVFGSFVDLEITDSVCYSIPRFHDFPNIKVIRMHNTTLENLSILDGNFQELSLLDLSHNRIRNINALELYSSHNIQLLNVSHNIVNTITEKIFSHVPAIKILDLTSNRIDSITSSTFYGLNNLNILYLSHNRISDINSAFEGLTELEEIYLDHNNLLDVKENWFKGLEKLTTLKLNSNSIIKFDWTTMEHIPMLKVFDVSNNGIGNVKKTAFAKNNNLNYVDLSSNNITQLHPNTFLKKEISFFAIQNNSLKGGLEIGMFEGMKMVSKLDLSHQNIDTIGDHAFYGLTSLSILLLNDNKIQNISKIAFYSLVDLAVLDLSNNMLHYINFEKHNFNNLKNLRFKNNLITDIATTSFMEMQSLEFLDLSQNNLTSFNSDTYSAILPHLKHLNISHNSLQTIPNDIFDTLLNIIWIDLSYNSNLTFAYNSTKKALVTNRAAQASSEFKSLGITHCAMDDVIFLKSYIFKAITYLDFTQNKIPKIEYEMFSSNKKLIHLDLSFNKIRYIQPGSFKDNNELKELNLAHNELIELEYGSFRGLYQLNLLDISFNKIKTLKHGKFYEISSLNTLIADNNNIESVEYKDFVGANLSTLSIGGNPIPCSLLVNLQTEMHTLHVTALNEEHHLPNFKGIACDPGIHINDSSNKDDDMYLERRDALLEDIRNVLLEIKKANYDKRFDPVTENIKKSFYHNEASWGDNARVHFDKLGSNGGELMQPTQRNFSIMSDVCLMFIAVVILCSLLYKVYELNLFRSLRRRFTASTELLDRQGTTGSSENSSC